MELKIGDFVAIKRLSPNSTGVVIGYDIGHIQEIEEINGQPRYRVAIDGIEIGRFFADQIDEDATHEIGMIPIRKQWREESESESEKRGGIEGCGLKGCESSDNIATNQDSPQNCLNPNCPENLDSANENNEDKKEDSLEENSIEIEVNTDPGVFDANNNPINADQLPAPEVIQVDNIDPSVQNGANPNYQEDPNQTLESDQISVSSTDGEPSQINVNQEV